MTKTTDAQFCGKCGVTEGSLHEVDCFSERCRQCGGQFISCVCIASYFYPESNNPREAALANGITEEQEAEWDAIIETLGGRVPYIDYPNLCCRCGKLWPDMFLVSDEEWARYVEPAHSHEMLCAECYAFIKSVIDANR